MDIKLADFDNDGDLDMYVSNVDSNESGGSVGAQNRFYENIDVDDVTINQSPDADPLGDGFFRDVTATAYGANAAVGSGILRYRGDCPLSALCPRRLVRSPVETGFDISTHSDIGDSTATVISMSWSPTRTVSSI